MGIKRTTADRHFSKCIRLRSNWTCDYCGMNFSHDPGFLHCSHFISRNYKIIRFNPMNALSHCHKCHEFLGGGRWGAGNQAEFVDHYDRIHGSQQRELMRILSKYPFRNFKTHEKAISKHYLTEVKRIEQMRGDGVMERIEIVPYDGCVEISRLMEELSSAIFL